MELQVIEQNVIVQAFNGEGGIQAIVEQIKSQIGSIVPDVSTAKGRKEIASLAHKVAKTKTAIDAEGKKLKEQYTVITNKIDADRKYARDSLDAERDRIRQPLTDWENAEKERVQKHLADIEKIKDFAHPSVISEMTAERIADQIRMLEVLEICPLFEEYEQEAKLAKFETLEALRTALVAREKYEAEQAELEAFEQAERIRWQKDHDERIAREATEKAQREAEEKARLEAERVQREKLEAEQREARLKAEKEAAELRAVQAAENERKRIKAEQFAKAEADRKAEEARLANVEHRRVINREAFDAIQALCLGIPEAQIKELIGAIAKNQVPHVSIKY
jgi:colicin import membrane protein